jgi:hypothetical protein
MSELFNGVWKIDVDRSKVWADEKDEYVPDEIGDEIITIRVADGVQDYEVMYGSNPTIRMGYTSRYDAPEWVAYEVREVITPPGVDAAQSVADFRRRIRADSGDRARSFDVGTPFALVRSVYVDERTHYRVSKSSDDGAAQSVMLRRLAEDGRSYVAAVLTVDGVVYRYRTFVRAD